MVNRARHILWGWGHNSATVMFGKRPFAIAIIASLAPALAACGGGTESGFSAYVADNWPHWAGGMPEGVPPRQGAPGYNEFISHGGANDPARTANAPAPEFVATGTTTANGKPVTPMVAPVNGKPSAAAAKSKSKSQPATAAQIAPPQAPPPQVRNREPERDEDQNSNQEVPQDPNDHSQDSSVVKGGLY
ncbi:MAG TPA: hypothetical protein VH206_02590 [Xanthobacteraceae bacterium]|jgi:hypothetical protein|nr:hypothetical protein [Xanthobacteraceae bacterium]